MNTLILLLALLVPQHAEGQVLPGTAYAQPAAGTILRSAPGKDFPGVTTLDGETVVRIGAVVGEHREVFVPQGFAVYMHADFLEYSPSDGTARVTGDRVNMRLLPSIEGLLPIGQLSAGTGPLVVLDRGTEWMRVVAPVVVPLYAPTADVQPVAGAEAATAWQRLYDTRRAHVAAAAAAWREQDPDAQHQDALLARVESLANVDLSVLTPEAMDQRRAELEDIRSQATLDRARSVADDLLAAMDELALLRARAARAAETVAVLQEAVDEQSLRRESRMLSLQLAFRGQGDVLTREGSVHRDGLPDAPIYTLHTTEGEILKLMALPQVATLEALTGKSVKVDGRRLLLMVVDGPVLVIDKLVAYSPR